MSDRVASRVTAAFVVLGALWILFSDKALESVVSDPGRLTSLQTYKGWFFVAISGLLIYTLTERLTHGRSQAERALARTEKLQRMLVQQLEDYAIIALDAHGRIASWDRGAEASLGHAAETVVGKPIAALYPPGKDPDWPHLDEIQKTGEGVYEAWCEKKDGTRIWTRTVITPLHEPGGAVAGYACVIHDLTDRLRRERQNAELLVREHAERLQAEDNAAWASYLADAAESFNENLDVEAAVLALASRACPRIADWSAVYLLDMSGAPYCAEVFHADPALARLTERLRNTRVQPDSGHPIFKVLATEKPVLLEALTEQRLREQVPDPHHFEALNRLGTRTAIFVPLVTHDTTIGVAAFGAGVSGRLYGDAHVARARELAEVAALAIGNAQLYRDTLSAREAAEHANAEVRRQLERMNALRAIDMAITGSVDLRVILGVILDQVTALLRVDAADVLLLDGSTRVLTCAAFRGFHTDEIMQTRLMPNEGTAGRAAFERRSVYTRDLHDPAEFRRPQLVHREGFEDHAAVPLVSKGEVTGVLEVFHRSKLDRQQDWMDFLEALAGQAAIAVENATMFENLQRSTTELALSYDRTLEGWSRALEYRDRETQGHTERVTDATVRLARVMGISDPEIVHVRRGALLHDIGKMGIPDSILLKPGPLTDDEWKVMKQHPLLAYQLLSPIPFLRPAIDIPLYHHERWNGRGYPYGLSGERIPLTARIFAVVDVWDALSSARPYRPAWPQEKVRSHLKQQAGVELDPAVVDAFLALSPVHDGGNVA